jgi:hypothetical protein
MIAHSHDFYLDAGKEVFEQGHFRYTKSMRAKGNHNQCGE